MALAPVSCHYVISFNYGGKKARDVSLTCRCYLSDILPDSIFYNSIGSRMTQFFLFWGGNRCLSWHRRYGFSRITVTPVGVGKH